MDGWMDGWTEGWMDGWMDGCVCKYVPDLSPQPLSTQDSSHGGSSRIDVCFREPKHFLLTCGGLGFRV